MRGHFEVDKRYPWSLQVRGARWCGFNAHTNEWLPGDVKYEAAAEELDEHIEKVRQVRDMPRTTGAELDAFLREVTPGNHG